MGRLGQGLVRSCVPTRLDRYLWRELWPPFGVAVFAFLVFIGLQLVLSLSDVLFARGVGAGEMLRLLLYKLPSLATLALPAGVLLAIVLALGRLASDRELLAFQAMGYPLRRLLLPFLAFGALASACSFALGEFAVPVAEAAYRRELLSILYQGEVPAVQEEVFFRGSEGGLYYVRRYDGACAQDVVMYDLGGQVFPESGPFPAVVTAGEGRFLGGDLELWDGRVLRFSADGGLEEVVRFERLVLAVGEEAEQLLLGGRTPSEMSLRELRARIDLLRRGGLDPRNLVVEYHSKLAVALAAFVFALFGAPLGALLGQRGRAMGAIAGFLVAAAAQGLFLWARILARRGFLPPFLGGWLPHIVFGLFGVVLLCSIDRLRLRGGLLVILLATLALPGEALPFTELWAEELVLGPGAKEVEGKGVRASLPGYELSAERLEAREEGTSWTVTAITATLSGQEGELSAGRLVLQLDPKGELLGAKAEDFSGSTVFQGPEKRERLLFSGDFGEARFAGGQLERLEAQAASFTTCPCLLGAPYRVRANRFSLLPKEWLYAEGVRVEAFGVLVGWLPVYAARLGEEASPLFPEFGRLGEEWFLRWHVPWSWGEGAWGTIGLTWFPLPMRVDPSFRLMWEGGELAVDRTGGRLRMGGPPAPWGVTASWGEARLSANLRAAQAGWQWALAWGRVQGDEGAVVYEKMPEFSLSRGGMDWLGGNLSLELSGGAYREEGVVGWRAGTGLSWSYTFGVGPLVGSLPWQVRLDQYPGQERVFLLFTPGLELGGLSLGTRFRWQWGRSPFEFDLAPPESRIYLSASGKTGGWTQGLHFGWDLAAEEALPGKWTLRGPIQVEVTFLPLPFAPERAKWSASWSGRGYTFALQGGFLFSPWRWEDTLVKGGFSGERFSLTGGVRLGPSFLLLRIAGEAEWRLSDVLALRAACEYDGPSSRILQLGGAVLWTFSGCLRVGVEADLSGVRFTLEVPAFPGARVRFSPLDEGLRLGE